MNFKCIIAAAAIAVLLAVSPAAAGELVNGNFESISGGNFTGWAVMPGSMGGLALVESSSVISGNYSAEIQPVGITWQGGLDYHANCTYSIDFAYFEPAYLNAYTYIAFYDSSVNSGSSICEAGLAWRVDDDGEFYLYDNSAIEIPEITVTPTVDDGGDGLWNGETPVLNHVELTTHFAGPTPCYDITVNGVTLTGLNYANQNSGLGDSLAAVDAVAFRLQGHSAQAGNWLVDNITMTPLPGPVPGDANDDGYVDSADAAILASNWLATGASWWMGDFNDDGVVDDVDATMLASNWQPAGSSVPEPGIAAMLLAGLLSLVLCSRRGRKS